MSAGGRARADPRPTPGSEHRPASGASCWRRSSPGRAPRRWAGPPRAGVPRRPPGRRGRRRSRRHGAGSRVGSHQSDERAGGEWSRPSGSPSKSGRDRPTKERINRPEKRPVRHRPCVARRSHAPSVKSSRRAVGREGRLARSRRRSGHDRCCAAGIVRTPSGRRLRSVASQLLDDQHPPAHDRAQPEERDRGDTGEPVARVDEKDQRARGDETRARPPRGATGRPCCARAPGGPRSRSRSAARPSCAAGDAGPAPRARTGGREGARGSVRRRHPSRSRRRGRAARR